MLIPVQLEKGVTMKRLFVIPLLLIAFTAQAQSAEFFPPLDTETQTVYIEGGTNSVGAGVQLLGTTAGVQYHRKFGQPGLYLNARITPVIVGSSAVELIAGPSGSVGYLIEGETETKAKWSAVAGLRFPTVGLELTSKYTFHYGDDYFVPVTARLYF